VIAQLPQILQMCGPLAGHGRLVDVARRLLSAIVMGWQEPPWRAFARVVTDFGGSEDGAWSFWDDWAEIRAQHGLVSGTLRDFVGLSFEYADYTMGYGRNTPGPPALVSTIKLMQAGFTEVIDTEAMFRKAFAEMQARKLLPPP